MLPSGFTVPAIDEDAGFAINDNNPTAAEIVVPSTLTEPKVDEVAAAYVLVADRTPDEIVKFVPGFTIPKVDEVASGGADALITPLEEVIVVPSTLTRPTVDDVAFVKTELITPDEIVIVELSGLAKPSATVDVGTVTTDKTPDDMVIEVLSGLINPIVDDVADDTLVLNTALITPPIEVIVVPSILHNPNVEEDAVEKSPDTEPFCAKIILPAEFMISVGPLKILVELL